MDIKGIPIIHVNQAGRVRYYAHEFIQENIKDFSKIECLDSITKIILKDDSVHYFMSYDDFKVWVKGREYRPDFDIDVVYRSGSPYYFIKDEKYAGPGRPQKTPEDKRIMINISGTPEAIDMLKHNAKMRGMTTSGYIIMLARKDAEENLLSKL